jgi:hypothetical protein
MEDHADPVAQRIRPQPVRLGVGRDISARTRIRDEMTGGHCGADEHHEQRGSEGSSDCRSANSVELVASAAANGQFEFT